MDQLSPQAPHQSECAGDTTHDDGFLTIEAFGDLYRVGRTRIYQLLNSNELEGVKSGARTLITRSSARAWAKRLPTYKAAKVA